MSSVSRTRARRRAALPSALLAICVFATPAFAQDAATGLRAWRLAGCALCHGAFGEGGGGGEQPEGPSLRKTALDRQTLTQTVRCGRPGSRMPYFLKGAYVEAPCWGMTAQAAPPGDVTGPGRLDAAAIDNLVGYLFERVIGKDETITKAECAAYYGNADHPGCADYK